MQGVAIFGPADTTRPPLVPRIWSAEEINWNRGDPASWQLMATGNSIPSLTLLGELPIGLAFTDNGNGTATISGTPDAEGTDYAFVVTATGSSGTYAQAFGIALLTLNNITSPNSATFTVGVPGSFTVTANGWLTPVIREVGPLSSGLTFTDTEEGYAFLAGTPAPGTAGTYTIEVHANGGFKVDGTHTFTLIVSDPTDAKPVIANPATTTMVIGGVDPPMPFVVTSTGSPTPALTFTGTLPRGVTFLDNGDSTATLAGTPLNTGTYPLMFDVGDSPEGLALNRNTNHLFITTATEAASEGNEAAGESGPEAPDPAGPNAGASVFHVDPVARTVVADVAVHSEGEYVAVNSKAGRVYHASQGTGEIAVIDGSTNVVLGFIPLTLDRGTCQPYQIAIDEAQNLIYAGAKAPPIPDPPGIPAPVGCKAIHEMPDDEYDCWNPGRVFVIDGETNHVVSSFLASDDVVGTKNGPGSSEGPNTKSVLSLPRKATQSPPG